MKLEDDATPINLDSSLEQYGITKQFLFRVLGQFSMKHKVNLDELLSDGAKDRLVLVSGGVVRDFLTLFNKSVDEARERILTNKGLTKVTAEDVNRASGTYYGSKLAELDKDIETGSKQRVLDQVREITDFCLKQSNANIFLVEKDISKDVENTMGELVDLKMIHQVKSGLSVRGRTRARFEAYLLDYTFYTGSRAPRNFEQVDFWSDAVRDDNIRRSKYVFLEREDAE